MIRSTVVVSVYALLLAGCESRDTRPDCEALNESQEAISACTADEMASIAAPLVGLGFQDGDKARANYFDGTITKVEDTALYIEAEGETFVFRWHGSWPVPVAADQQIRVYPSTNSGAVLIDGRFLVVMNPRSEVGSRLNSFGLCLEQSLGCQASHLTYALDYGVWSPFFEGQLPVGQAVQVGEWMVSNPGVVHTSARTCDELDGDFDVRQRRYPGETSGQLLAWTVDPAVLQQDPAWCSGTVTEGNKRPVGGPFGYKVSTDGQWLPGEIGHVTHMDSYDWINVKVAGVWQDFKWPGRLPSTLLLGDEVEISTQGEHSALKSESHVLWTIEASHPPEQTIPGAPEVRYEPGCLISNSSQIAAAIVSWQGDSIRLLPGETAELGPWTVVHHHGVFSVSDGCNPDGSTRLRALASAIRSLED